MKLEATNLERLTRQVEGEQLAGSSPIYLPNRQRVSKIELKNAESIENTGRKGSKSAKAIIPMVETPRATMPHNLERLEHPPNPPIDPLVRLRGLPILVPCNLTMLEMPSHLPTFHGLKDEDPSRHMEWYVKILASSSITDPRYCLMWFPTTLQGEAYGWYKGHCKGHFRE